MSSPLPHTFTNPPALRFSLFFFFLHPPSLPPRTSWLSFPFSLNPSEGLFHCLLLYVITGESGLLCILLAAKLKPLAPTLEQSLDTLGNTHICFLSARRGRDKKIDISSHALMAARSIWSCTRQTASAGCSVKTRKEGKPAWLPAEI